MVSNGKQWRETDFYWHEAVRMETPPLFISNFSPQIGIRCWALQCLKHHFLSLWCGKHDLIPVQCFSSDSPSLQIVFVWHHIEGVIVHHCGWWSATSSGKAKGKKSDEGSCCLMLQYCYWSFLASEKAVYNIVVMFSFSESDSVTAVTAVKTTATNEKWL